MILFGIFKSRNDSFALKLKLMDVAHLCMRIAEMADGVSAPSEQEQKSQETTTGATVTREETAPSQETSGQEWTSSRRTGRRAQPGINRHPEAVEELRVDTGVRAVSERARESNGEKLRAEDENEGREEDQETLRDASLTAESKQKKQVEEPVIPVTVLPSMQAQTKHSGRVGDGGNKRLVLTEYVAGRDEGEDTEDDIALLEYLSGTESDYYEMDRASRKGEDGDNKTPIMALSPRSEDESLGTPESPGGLLSVEEHGGFGLSPVRYTSVRRRSWAHAQEAPRQTATLATQIVESPTGIDSEGKTTDTHGAAEALEEKKAQVPLPTSPRQTERARTTATQEDESEWVSCVTEDGVPYYYNKRTLESQWTLPNSPRARTYTNDELFAFAAATELSETDSRRMSIMLHSGMDLQIMNSEGLTPLHVACNVGNEQAAALLVYYGAKVDARAQRDNSTPLILACRRESENNIKLLVEANASLSASDSNGDTSLHAVVHTGNEELVMFVLNACDHALFTQKNNESETALHIAAKHGYLGVVRSLLAYGASTKDEDAQGRTPLILSILENHVECVQLLQSVESTTNPTSSSTATPPYRTSPNTPESRPGSGGERDALAILHSYLFQLLASHTAAEAQTVYQLVEDVRGQISALSSSVQASSDREARCQAQIDEMSSKLAATTEEVKKEKGLHSDTQNRLGVREIELEANRVSHRALTSRCELLESIARNAQEKLGRERSEHARDEEAMQEKLRQSLQENANVIESCRQLQARWSEKQLYDKRLDRRDSQGFYETTQAPNHYFSESNRVATADSTASYGSNQFRERAWSDQQQLQNYYSYAHPVNQYQIESAPENVDQSSPLEDDDLKRHGQYSPVASPDRVNAVWNRFFENVGQSGEEPESSVQKPSSDPQGESRSMTPFPTSSVVFDAVRKSELQKLQEILLRGVSPNQRDVAEKGTPLHLACELGDIDAVMLLCEFTADLEARDETGNTPLLAACLQGNFDCARFLLQSAVSLRAVNENGDSALHLAAWDGSIDCVMILLEYGIDPMTNNRFGLTALGNMKTRSPMRHKFDDLPEDHPMRRTLVVLEEAELQNRQTIQEQSGNDQATIEHKTQLARQESSSSASSSRKASWTQWLLGFRGPSANGSGTRKPESEEQRKSESNDASTSATTATEENEVDSEDADDLASYEESRLAMDEKKYERLTPPPEVEEALRRAKAYLLGGENEPNSPAAAPTHPLTRQDLAKHTRNAKSPPPPAPSTVRSRRSTTKTLEKMSMLLRGKRALVVGLMNKHSLAAGVTQALLSHGASVVVSSKSPLSQNHILNCDFQVPSNVDPSPALHFEPCDVEDETSIDTLMERCGQLFDGQLDILVHSVAFAPKEAFTSGLLNTPKSAWTQAMDVSAYSLVALTRAAKPLLVAEDKEGERRDRSVMALTYAGSTKVVPNYNVMGPAKAALEATARQLAFELGPEGIRVNCLSPGPMNTVSARGIPGISKMRKYAQDHAPLRQNSSSGDVGSLAAFLASDLSKSITGQTIYVDGGLSAMAPYARDD